MFTHEQAMPMSDSAAVAALAGKRVARSPSVRSPVYSNAGSRLPAPPAALMARYKQSAVQNVSQTVLSCARQTMLIRGV